MKINPKLESIKRDNFKSPQQFFESIKKYLRVMRSSKDTQGELEVMKNHLAFDRVMTRITMSERREWALKGGFLMNLRFLKSRATRDIDLTLISSDNKEVRADEVHAMLAEDLAKDCEDNMKFIVGEGDFIKDGDGAVKGGLRFDVKTMIGGNLFTSFHIDVGLMDIPFEKESKDFGCSTSGFFGLTQKAFPVISVEQQFAEKLHAYTLPMGRRENTRFKDLVDMKIMIDSGILSRDKVVKAIDWVFEHRSTHQIDELCRPPESWEKGYAHLAKGCEIDVSVDNGFATLSSYLENNDILNEADNASCSRGLRYG